MRGGRTPVLSAFQRGKIRELRRLACPSSIGARQMNSKQYLFVALVCISFAAIVLVWLMEPTLEKAVNALK
jgi:hypothetical protein